MQDNVNRTYVVTFVSTVDPTFTCTEEVIVNDPAFSLPTFGAVMDVDVCGNNPVQIGVTNMNPELEYIWTPAEGLDNPMLSNPTATVDATMTYVGVVTDIATGCLDSAMVTVNVQGIADAGPDIFVCDNGTAFGTATTYTPSAADRARGEVTLILTTDDPSGPCGEESASVTFIILNVDCGTFPWNGN